MKKNQKTSAAVSRSNINESVSDKKFLSDISRDIQIYRNQYDQANRYLITLEQQYTDFEYKVDQYFKDLRDDYADFRNTLDSKLLQIQISQLARGQTDENMQRLAQDHDRQRTMLTEQYRKKYSEAQEAYELEKGNRISQINRVRENLSTKKTAIITSIRKYNALKDQIFHQTRDLTYLNTYVT